MVNVRSTEHLIEKIKALLPTPKLSDAEKEKILSEPVTFSIDSFIPLVCVPDFTKEDAYLMLNERLKTSLPKNMNADETELLKPFLLNLLMLFRLQGHTYAQRVRAGLGRFGGICDRCNGDARLDTFFLAGGNNAFCPTCALTLLVENIDWNNRLAHVTDAVGNVPNLMIEQAYEIKEKIERRRAAK